MNYRHAFHAGNFADVMKHIILVRILHHLRRKEAPFRAIDTHAGIGRYDLVSSEADRTGEWRDGIGRMVEPFGENVEELIAPYRAIIADTRVRYGPNAYPGSPAIMRELLRREDRAIFVELHPEDGAVLRERFNAVANTKVLALDGWTALRSLLPPKERRGLVLIDPPYEEPGELMRSVDRLREAVARWPTGIYALWYPIKNLAEIDAFYGKLGRAVDRENLRLDLVVDSPDPRGRLIGSGLALINPPWTLADEARAILAVLAPRLARSEAAGFRCELASPGSH